jgi:hypothetical protein
MRALAGSRGDPLLERCEALLGECVDLIALFVVEFPCVQACHSSGGSNLVAGRCARIRAKEAISSRRHGPVSRSLTKFANRYVVIIRRDRLLDVLEESAKLVCDIDRNWFENGQHVWSNSG